MQTDLWHKYADNLLDNERLKVRYVNTPTGERSTLYLRSRRALKLQPSDRQLKIARCRVRNGGKKGESPTVS